jgi:cytochrome c
VTRLVLAGLAILLAGPAGSAEPDLINGRLLFARCGICHALTAEKSKGMKGPTLAGLFGRKAGTVKGYKYSKAMRTKGVVWSEKTLDAYLTKPKAYVPGTKMIYSGLRRAADRRDLIAYLKKTLKSQR